jgi:hypothetical protein
MGSAGRAKRAKMFTSEANFDGTVIITHAEVCIAVTAIPGVDSGLDKPEKEKDTHSDLKMNF